MAEFTTGPDKLDRRGFLRMCGAAGVAVPGLPLILSACGSQSSGATLSSNQNLNIGWAKDEYVTSGAGASTGMYPLNLGVYEPLVRMGADYSVNPNLATHWQQTSGGTVWTFYLRPGVKWHDGTPLTADDVKYTFDRQASAQSGPTGLGTSSTVVVDAQTVRFTLTQPNFRFVESCVHPYLGILKKGAQPGPPGVGTGPFRWVEYVPQTRAKVTRSHTYWGTAGVPANLTFHFITDDNSRALALASGQLDLAADIARPTVANLSHRSDVSVVHAPVGAYTAFYVNIAGKPPYDIGADPAVRLALETGIDRTAFLHSVFSDLGAATQTLTPPAVLGSSASKIQGFSYDPARARTSLDAAGWTQSGNGVRTKNGRPLQLTLINGFPDASSNAGVGEFVQANLQSIGIGITIKSEPDTDSYSAVEGMGAGDLFVETGNQNDADPTFLPTGVFDSKLGFPGYQIFAPGASVDDPISTALNSPSDDQARASIAEAIHQIVDVSMVLVQLAGVYRIFGVRSDIRGLIPNPSDVSQGWSTLYRVK